MAVTELARGLISEVGFDSQITPAYRSDPFAPAPPASGFGAWIMGKIRPRFWVRTPAGVSMWAPHGNPVDDYTPTLVLGAVLTGAAIVASAVAVGMWLERNKKRGRR